MKRKAIGFVWLNILLWGMSYITFEKCDRLILADEWYSLPIGGSLLMITIVIIYNIYAYMFD